MTGISRDEWLAALHEAGLTADEDDRDAITAAEFAAMFSLTRLTAERRLRALEAAGKATRTRKRATLGNGRVMACVAYRLVPQDTPTPKRRGA